MSNGDFDGLPVDSRPDCENNAGAGAWSFGTSYVQAGVCESSAEQYSIATTDSFDPGAKGNSLHLLVVNEPASNFHLPNRFNVVLQEGDPVTVAFDIWVVSGGGGGSVYVGGQKTQFAKGFDASQTTSWRARNKNASMTPNRIGSSVRWNGLRNIGKYVS